MGITTGRWCKWPKCRTVKWRLPMPRQTTPLSLALPWIGGPGISSGSADRPEGDPATPMNDGPTFSHPPAAARAALDRLGEIDADLGAIEARAGPLPWRTRPTGFAGLL